VSLLFPDVAVDDQGNFGSIFVWLFSPLVYSSHHSHSGFWTMIYDQGFEVQINGRKVCVFFDMLTHLSDMDPSSLPSRIMRLRAAR
jgi:hypothetical protein